MSLKKQSADIIDVKIGTLNIKAIYKGTLLDWIRSTTSTTLTSTTSTSTTTSTTSTTTSTTTTTTTTTAAPDDVTPDLSSSMYIPSVGSEASSIWYRGTEYPYLITDTSGKYILYATYRGVGDDPGNNIYYRYEGDIGWKLSTDVEYPILSGTYIETGLIGTIDQVVLVMKYNDVNFRFSQTLYGCYEYTSMMSGNIYYCYRPGVGNSLSTVGWYTDYNNSGSGIIGVTVIQNPNKYACLDGTTSLHLDLAFPVDAGSWTYYDAGNTWPGYRHVFDPTIFYAAYAMETTIGDWVDINTMQIVTIISEGTC